MNVQVQRQRSGSLDLGVGSQAIVPLYAAGGSGDVKVEAEENDSSIPNNLEAVRAMAMEFEAGLFC